jgi:hypothetical protein
MKWKFIVSHVDSSCQIFINLKKKKTQIKLISILLELIDHFIYSKKGSSWPWSYGSWIYNNLCNQCQSSLMLWVRISIRARCTTLCDKVCQWLVTGQWFSPGPPVSSTNRTDRHDITEILLKKALNAIKNTNKKRWRSPQFKES